MRRHRRSTRRPGGGSRRWPTASPAAPSAPPTPTASPTSTSAPCSSSTPRTAAAATMTVVRPHLQWGVAELDGRPGRRLRREAAQRALDQRRLPLLRAGGAGAHRRRQRARARAAGASWPRPGELRAFRHEGFWDCMDTYKDAVVLDDLWNSGRAPWRVWDAAAAGAVKRALVTGGHGFVASQPGAGAARARRRGDACSTCAAPPLSGLALQGIAARGRAGRGRPPRRRARSAPRSSRASSTSSSTSAPRPWSARRWPTRPRPSRPTCAGPGPCSRPAGGRRCRRSSSPPPTRPTAPARSCPTARRCGCAPASPYEASKAAADAIALSYRPAYGLPVAVTRFANIYGGGDLNFSRLIPEAIAAVLDGRRPQIRSDGSPERDFLYVDDAVAAYLAVEHAVGAGGPGGGRGLQRRRRAPAPGARGAGDDRRGLRLRPRARVPRHRQPGRGDRPPVRRLDEAARADRLGAGRSDCATA